MALSCKAVFTVKDYIFLIKKCENVKISPYYISQYAREISNRIFFLSFLAKSSARMKPQNGSNVQCFINITVLFYSSGCGCSIVPLDVPVFRILWANR